MNSRSPPPKETAAGFLQIIALGTKGKELESTRQPKKYMYIAEFARVLLATIVMTYLCGWQCIQIHFFSQLAAITASPHGALLQLRYRDIGLKLIRDPEGGQPRLFITSRPDFTKGISRKGSSEGIVDFCGFLDPLVDRKLE